MAPRDQRLDHRHHRRDEGGRARLPGRRQRAERAHVLVVPGRRLGGDRLDRPSALGGPRVDLVLDVGDVAHVGDLRLAIDVAQQPEERVEHHHRPGVADVRAVIDRRPADVHPHVGRIERHEALLRSRPRVVEFDLGHCLAILPRRAITLVRIWKREARRGEMSAANADGDGAAGRHAPPYAPNWECRSSREPLMLPDARRPSAAASAARRRSSASRRPAARRAGTAAAPRLGSAARGSGGPPA